jgi:RHS repeat-associated protein
VRANGNGERFAYYPYGEERGVSAGGREKFGTYVRDGAGQDYADQRYYGVGKGRFNVPDPSLSSNALVLPGNWNSYTYVGGDPINRNDPRGLCSPDDDPPCYSATGTGSIPGGGLTGVVVVVVAEAPVVANLATTSVYLSPAVSRSGAGVGCY